MSIVKEFLRTLNGVNDYDLAKSMSDLGRKMMNRVCNCGHLCKEHNFVNANSKDYPNAQIADSCKNCLCVKFNHYKSADENKIIIK